MQRVGFLVCAALVFASMVGTGVFTSLGFQVAALPSPPVILLLWSIGGLVALCGALSYAELAAALPRSGGEYHFLARIFHPATGLMAGFVSVFVGFSAPIALGALAFGRYAAAAWPGLPPLPMSLAIVVGLALVHAVALRVSGGFQLVATLFKALLICGFIVLGCAKGNGLDLTLKPGDLLLVGSAPFAVSLMFVLYSYSGWNAAVYITGEVENPARAVPAALVCATLAVIMLYVLLNAVFLASAPVGDFAGRIEVGEIAATALLGPDGGRLMSTIISIGLVSSLSALTWAGPRVAQAAGRDFPALAWFAVTTRSGVPRRALLFQTSVVLLLLLTASFEAVLVYAQFALIACSALTVVGLFVLRWREPGLARPFRCPGYPFVPAIFLLASVFTLGYTIVTRPLQAGAGLATLACGAMLYFAVRRK